MEHSDAVATLAALAQTSRLQVFRTLVGAEPRGLTPGVLSATLGLPPATLSFHLKELANAGLVTQERSGRHLTYRAAFAHVDSLLDYLTAHCCQGQACRDERTPRRCEETDRCL